MCKLDSSLSLSVHEVSTAVTYLGSGTRLTEVAYIIVRCILPQHG